MCVQNAVCVGQLQDPLRHLLTEVDRSVRPVSRTEKAHCHLLLLVCFLRYQKGQERLTYSYLLPHSFHCHICIVILHAGFPEYLMVASRRDLVALRFSTFAIVQLCLHTSCYRYRRCPGYRFVLHLALAGTLLSLLQLNLVCPKSLTTQPPIPFSCQVFQSLL